MWRDEGLLLVRCRSFSFFIAYGWQRLGSRAACVALQRVVVLTTCYASRNTISVVFCLALFSSRQLAFQRLNVSEGMIQSLLAKLCAGISVFWT